MSYDFHVTHQKNAGFKLVLEKRSLFRDTILTWADGLCKITGHRGCNSWYAAVDKWADAGRGEGTISVELPIDRETADSIAELQGHEDGWDYLDEEEWPDPAPPHEWQG
jgi:hypothetical protein